MTLPTSRTVPVDGLWRIVVWERPTRSYSLRVVGSWEITRVSTSDSFSFEVGLTWTLPGGLDATDDLDLIALAPPSTPLNFAELLDVYGPKATEPGPYAIKQFGITGAIRREVDRGDKRLKKLLDLGQRLAVSWSVEAAMVEEENEASSPAPCTDCGLVFKDVWSAGTHKGQVHRFADPACLICGMRSCESVIGKALHAALTEEMEVDDVKS